jgi:hypothetical protein
MKNIEWPEGAQEYAPFKASPPKREKAFVNFNVNSKSKIATLS